MNRLRIELCARALSLAIDAVAWGLDRFADLAGDAAEDARWWANALRCVP